jgi:hypothetical protein
MSNFVNIGRKLAVNVFKTLNQKVSVNSLQSPIALSSQIRYVLCNSNSKINYFQFKILDQNHIMVNQVNIKFKKKMLY